MHSAARMLRVLLLLLDVGAAQVLATGKTAGAETDIKYAIIGTAVGIAISAGFLALKFCMIRKHMFDNDSSDLRSTNVGFNETIALKKRASRNLCGIWLKDFSALAGINLTSGDILWDGPRKTRTYRHPCYYFSFLLLSLLSV
ncbi:transmembrane protein 273 isoform X1 [Cervus elaphus]|uniref:transmembrane protein 273 isoform X1 n=1 Tax=Cervus canadensis TaxID=1574408 RepID=UPI0018BD4190|nr:transmembrane protein 273 isoform X1 [Cervus canadensis]XP_043782628.1 transmembrane protein 273 isoform X1 [Cervus elaphus]